MISYCNNVATVIFNTVYNIIGYYLWYLQYLLFTPLTENTILTSFIIIIDVTNTTHYKPHTLLKCFPEAIGLYAII